MAMPRDPNSPPLSVSRFDRVTSFVVALAALLGGSVLLLFVVWLTAALTWSKPPSLAVFIDYEGRDDHAAGFQFDREPPGLDELPEVAAPTLRDSLEAVTNVLSSQTAAFEVASRDMNVLPGGSKRGDRRRPGPPGTPPGSIEVIPPAERWELNFNSTSIAVYARQLDFFDIELCSYGGGRPTIDFAFNLSKKPRPDRRSLNKPDTNDPRVFFAWKGGPLLNYDRQLLENAGIPTSSRVVCMFLPQELVARMQSLEAQSGRAPAEWLKTIWGVRESGANQWEFFIEKQYFRTASGA